MERLRAHPVAMTLLAFALAVAAVAAVAIINGFSAFRHAWSHLHFGWLALVIAGELLAVPAYAALYRKVAELEGGPRTPFPLLVRLVIAGFGPFAPDGGFALDKRALEALEKDEQSAIVRVLGLGALEWALLAPAAWVAALVLLATGDPRPMPSLLWPWVIAVPIGFAVGLWLAVPARTERIAEGDGRWRKPLGKALRGVGVLHTLARDLARSWLAWTGTALYWALDIAAFYGAVRFVGLKPDLGETVLAYATGYALTRRSMPLGGAGATELLMTFSLHWVGQPIAPALAAVVVYRVFNFLLPAGPALLVRRRLRPLLNAAAEDRPPSQTEQRRAAAPLGHPQQ
jgi:uncharacterized membrane protein YbhN (UPF0104 family)